MKHQILTNDSDGATAAIQGSITCYPCENCIIRWEEFMDIATSLPTSNISYNYFGKTS